jgi:hypothetical protein
MYDVSTDCPVSLAEANCTCRSLFCLVPTSPDSLPLSLFTFFWSKPHRLKAQKLGSGPAKMCRSSALAHHVGLLLPPNGIPRLLSDRSEGTFSSTDFNRHSSQRPVLLSSDRTQQIPIFVIIAQPDVQICTLEPHSGGGYQSHAAKNHHSPWH